MSLQSRCQQHHHEQDGEPYRPCQVEWPGLESLYLDDILGKERVFGGITEPAWKAFSISQDAFP